MDRCTTKLVIKSKPNDKNLGYPSIEEQSHILPWLQGIGRHAIPIFLEFQKSGYWSNSPNYWNSRNRSISKIGSTPGNTQIGNFDNSAYFWNSTNRKTEIIYYINGIPEIGIYVKIVTTIGIPKIGAQHISGIPLVGTFFTFWNSLDFRLVCRK